MKNNRKIRMLLALLTAGGALVGGSYAVIGAESQPTYESSVKISDQSDGESGEAANLASMAKIDATAATAAALAQVPGSVLQVSLDNENGNLVYSVEIKTAANAIQDVKVDAGTAKLLSVDAGGEDAGNEEGGNSEDGSDEGNSETAN